MASLHADKDSLHKAIEAVLIAVRKVKDHEGKRVMLPLPHKKREDAVDAGVNAIVNIDMDIIRACVLSAMRQMTGHHIEDPIND